MGMPRVIWLKPVRGRYGKTIQRIAATLITASEHYCTVELESGVQVTDDVADEPPELAVIVAVIVPPGQVKLQATMLVFCVFVVRFRIGLYTREQ